METQIRKRQQRIAKLRRHREAWRVALEKLDAHENWREELDSHLEESQVAQIGALQTSTGLIMGVAGPVSDALAARADLARRLKRVVARLRLQLRELDPIIKRVEAASGRSLDHRRVARQLRELHDELTRATRSEVALSRLLGDLVTFGDRLMKVASFVELIKDVRTKHEALAAAKLLDDMVVDAFKEAGVAEVTEGMARRGLHQGARSIKLLSFGVDYGYHSLRFYLAWDGVQQVLGRIDDKNRLRGHMSQQIVSLTNAAKAEEAELAQLRQARGNRARSQAVLQTLRQRELKAAYQAGEWFSQQRGVAAPGGPLRP